MTIVNVYNPTSLPSKSRAKREKSTHTPNFSEGGNVSCRAVLTGRAFFFTAKAMARYILPAVGAPCCGAFHRGARLKKKCSTEVGVRFTRYLDGCHESSVGCALTGASVPVDSRSDKDEILTVVCFHLLHCCSLLARCILPEGRARLEVRHHAEELQIIRFNASKRLHLHHAQKK